MNADTSLMFAGGHVDITPERPIRLGGRGTRRKPWNRLRDRLEANAILLRHGGEKIAFVQVDALTLGDRYRREVLARLKGRLADDELMLMASHTHSACNLDPRLPKMGNVDEDYAAAVTERMIALLDGMLSAPGEPVDLRYGEAPTAHTVNRRKTCLAPAWGFPPWKRIMALHPNAAGPRDDVLRSLSLRAGRDRASLAGVLWNFACHPVTIAGFRDLSADYPGDLRRALRRRAAAEIPVVFLPGFGGDVRPNRVRRLPLSPYYLAHRMVNGPVFGFFTPRARARWIASLAQAAAAAVTDASRPCRVSRMRSRRQAQPFQLWLDNPIDDRAMSVHLVSLGEEVVLVGLSAEAVVEYAPLVRAALPGKTVLAVGYLDGNCGYLPTTEMLAEGGMEVISPSYDLGTPRYHGDLSEAVVATIRGLAEAEC